MPDATLPEGAPSAPLSEHAAVVAIGALRAKAAPAPAPKTEPAPQQAAEPEPTTEPTEPAAPAAEAPPEGTQTEPADATAVAEQPLTTSSLAEKLGLEEPKLYDIRVKTKIDGVDGEATLAQLIKSYQTEQSLTQRSMKFADERKEADAKLNESRQAIVQREQQLNSVIPVLNKLLEADFAGVNWDEIQKTDFNQYLQLKEAYGQRMAGINQIKSSLQQEQQKALDTQRQHFTEWAKREEQALHTKLPQWNDAKVAERERAAIAKTAKSYGFTDQEIATAFDHRTVLLLRDAMQFQELQAKKPAVMAKVNQAPPIARPSTPGKNTSPVADARAKFQSSKSEADAAALLGALRASKKRA